MSSPSRVIAQVVAPLVNTNEPQSQVIEITVAAGDRVAEGDLICVLETSKSTADVEAEVAGHVGPLRVRLDDMVDAGAVICEIFDGPPPEAPTAGTGGDGAAPRLTRKAEAMVREAGITDLSSLPTDRFITQADIEELIARQATTGPVELAPEVVAAITPRSLIVFGGGGLGRCVIEMVRAAGDFTVLGVVDDGRTPGDQVLDVPVLGGRAALGALAGAGLRHAAHAVGGVGRMSLRADVATAITDQGLEMPAIVDPTAGVSPSAELGPGTQVHAGAMVMAGAEVGRDVLINTGAIISHDCRIGDHSHIAPGAILAGDVTVGEATLVGMGVTVLLGVTIGANCIIGNGADLLADVPDGARIPVGAVWNGPGVDS